MPKVNMQVLRDLYLVEAAGQLEPEQQQALDTLRAAKQLPPLEIGLDDPTFDEAEKKYGLPPGMLRAVGGVESSGRSTAVSPTGVTGLMQVTLGTGKKYGLTRTNRVNPYLSIDIAARHLSDLMEETGGDIKRTVARYGDQNEKGYADKVLRRWYGKDKGKTFDPGTWRPTPAEAAAPPEEEMPAIPAGEIPPGITGETGAPPSQPPAPPPGSVTTTTATTTPDVVAPQVVRRESSQASRLPPPIPPPNPHHPPSLDGRPLWPVSRGHWRAG
jgi:hypothetical protein